MPVLSKIKGKEREISREQVALALRLRNSAYYEMEDKKADGKAYILRPTLWGLSSPLVELERYSDRFKPAAKTRPLLSQEILNKEFFPPALWEAYFNQKKKAATGLPFELEWLGPDLTRLFARQSDRQEETRCKN